MAGAILAGTFNAFAFAGAGFLFSKINKSGYDAEMKRHNHAMEQLAKARDEWNQARLKEIDRVSNLRYDKMEGAKDIKQTNEDLINVETKFAESEPKLSQYYKPGAKMIEYKNIVKYGMTIPIIYGLITLL